MYRRMEARVSGIANWDCWATIGDFIVLVSDNWSCGNRDSGNWLSSSSRSSSRSWSYSNWDDGDRRGGDDGLVLREIWDASNDDRAITSRDIGVDVRAIGGVANLGLEVLLLRHCVAFSFEGEGGA